MPLLSVNVNKVATLRNSRGGELPSVCAAVRVCLDAGARGITVHPRADQRHITPHDVREIARLLAQVGPGVEFNIEGDPRPDLIDLVLETRPHQCTLVPVQPGEVTSQAGWGRTGEVAAILERSVRRLRDAGVRVSLFIDPDRQAADWAAELGADRVELFTEPFARAFAQGAAAGATVSSNMPPSPGTPTPAGWESTRVTISISTISRCSPPCLTWPKSRSGMPSSAGRCSRGCTRWSASTWRSAPNPTEPDSSAPGPHPPWLPIAIRPPTRLS